MTCLNYIRMHSIYHSFQKSLDGDASALRRLKALFGCHMSPSVWLWYNAFIRHNLSACLCVAHVTAHVPLFSRFSVFHLGFWSFLKSISHLYILACTYFHIFISFSTIFVFLRERFICICLFFWVFRSVLRLVSNSSS